MTVRVIEGGLGDGTPPGLLVHGAAEVATLHGLPEDPVVEFTAVMERMRQLRARLSSNDSAHRFRELGVDVFFGQGRFLNGSQVEVGGAKLTFRRAVIATGSRAVAPAIPGLDSIDHLNHESLFSLTQLPRRLAVIGAGPIGCEMAQAFQQFGSHVTLLESTPGILTREDRDAAAIVQDAMEHDGVRVRCNVRELAIATKHEGAEHGAVQHGTAQHGDGVLIRGVSQSQSWEAVADRILVAAGRAANVEGLGLDSADVAYGSKGIQVNDRLQTTNPRIYAAGDVCSVFPFTHAADAMARVVIQNALFWGRKRASALLIPWCTYTTPELAHVGLSQAVAESRGVGIDVYQEHFAECDRAVLDGEEAGFVRVLCRRGTDQILGVTIVGANAGDLIGECHAQIETCVALAETRRGPAPFALLHCLADKESDRLLPPCTPVGNGLRIRSHHLSGNLLQRGIIADLREPPISKATKSSTPPMPRSADRQSSQVTRNGINTPVIATPAGTPVCLIEKNSPRRSRGECRLRMSAAVGLGMP